MVYYPEPAVEQAMKVPEVILRAVAKSIRGGIVRASASTEPS